MWTSHRQQWPACRWLKLQWIVLIALAISTIEVFAGSHDWIYSRHFSLYIVILRDRQLDAEARIWHQKDFHRFAFEYWQVKRRNPDEFKDLQRLEKLISRVLRKEAANEAAKNDPVGLLPHFKDGELGNVGLLPIVEGIDFNTITEVEYRRLVAQFIAFYFNDAKE